MWEYVNYCVFLVLQGFHLYFGEKLFWDTSLSNDTYFQGIDRNASEPKQSFNLPNYVFVRSSNIPFVYVWWIYYMNELYSLA